MEKQKLSYEETIERVKKMMEAGTPRTTACRQIMKSYIPLSKYGDKYKHVMSMGASLAKDLPPSPHPRAGIVPWNKSKKSKPVTQDKTSMSEIEDVITSNLSPELKMKMIKVLVGGK